MPRKKKAPGSFSSGAARSDSSGAAGSDSSGERPRKKAVGERPRKKAVEASSRWAPPVHPGERATVARGEMAPAPSRGVSMVHPREAAACAQAADGCIWCIPERRRHVRPRATPSGGGEHHGEALACAAPSGGGEHHGEALACAALSGGGEHHGEALPCAALSGGGEHHGEALPCAALSGGGEHHGEALPCAALSGGGEHHGEALACVALSGGGEHHGEAVACAAPSSGGVHKVHPGEEVVCSSAEMAPSSGGVHMVHPGEEVVCSSADMAPSSGGVHMVHPGEEVVCSSAEMPCKKADASSSGGAPRVHSGEGVPVTSGEMAAASSGEVLMVFSQEAAACWNAEIPYKMAASSSSRGVQMVHPVEGAMVHPGERAEVMTLSGGSAALVDFRCKTTAQDYEESAAKHHTKKAHIVSSGKIQQEHCTEDKADMGLRGGVLQKQTSKVEADTSLSGEMLREHPAKEADTSLIGEMLDQHEHPADQSDAAKDIKECDPNEAVHVKKTELHIQDIHEAYLLVKEMNQSGVGEDISEQEFLSYYDQLASGPPWIDRKAGLTEEGLVQQYVDHALCRFRYYKYKLSQPKEEPHGDNLLEEEEEDDKEKREFLATLTEKQLLFFEEDDTTSEEDDNLKDKTEGDCTMEFLEEKGFFISFEEDGTLDWFFYPAYCECASLSDYQRLVLKNYGGTEYHLWSDYHSYLNSYDIEQEYLKYCKELSKQLKWMEDYVDICRSSVKWGKISSRGAFQAIKIAATSFPKITPTLAYNGFDEYKQRICYYHTWFKEYDRLYFEIWRRVTKGTSFRKAMEDVCKMNTFPVRQGLMQTALDHEYTMTLMEEDFHTCTAAIRPGVKEDEVMELIADGVKKLVNMPKSYEDYIIKKIKIARIVGILPSEETED